MGARAEHLAALLEQVNSDVIATVAGLSDDQWRAVTVDEGWSVAVLAHHIAVSYDSQRTLVEALAHGQPLPPLTLEMINASNAEHARQFAGVSQAETLALLHTRGSQAIAAVRALADQQFDRAGHILGAVVTCQQIIESILISHPRSHLRSIKKVLS